jgi:ribosomal protein S27E
VAIAIFFAYPPFTIIAILAVTVALLLITAVASPKRTDLDDELSEFPLVDCPACTTANPITSDERPLRIPCGGCGKVLKIVS